MKKLILRIAAPIAVLAVIASLLAVMACSESEYRRLTRSQAEIASALGAIYQLTVDSANAQLITRDVTVAILVEVDHGTVLNGQFRDRLRQAKNIQPGDRAALAQFATDLLASIDRLNENGVLHIKDPDTQAKFAAAVNAARVAIVAVSAITVSEVKLGSIDDVKSRADGRSGHREADCGSARAIGNERRAAPGLGSAEGCGNARGSSEVSVDGDAAGQQPFVLVLVVRKCNELASTEREWRTGRCRLRT
jgi:hypothetical protein